MRLRDDRRMTTETNDTPTTPTTPAPRRPWLPLLLTGIAVVIVAGAAIGIVIVRDDDSNDNGTVAGTQQLASVQQACAQWRDAYSGSSAPSSSWCNDMVGWMTGQMNSGQMMGTMMWGDPDRMRDTCRQWMSTNPAGSGSALNTSAWCDQMVGWMTQNMGDWDDWMMNGSMMNR